jgi:hypothetical protein
MKNGQMMVETIDKPHYNKMIDGTKYCMFLLPITNSDRWIQYRVRSDPTIQRNPIGIRVTESLTDPTGGFRWISDDIWLLELV